MIKSKILTLLIFGILLSLDATARPKIGLVLSGGGARGAAHVGVLKVLEELQIPIDMITGTSMGSIVGGLYASGMSASEIEVTMNALDWDYLLKDDLNRENLSINRKNQEDLFSVRFHPGYNDGKVVLPPGAIQGQKVELVLQRLTTHVAHLKTFDDLPIPFRAVATDIVTGEKVVLSGGNLGRAMRASMSVPSIFAPIEIDGKILVDGGISDNLPVDLAREMGADILIVIDIGSPLRGKGEITNLLTITDQLTRLITGRNVIASRARITDADILILPNLGNITAGQFDRAAEAIPIGEAAARDSVNELRKLSLSDADFENYKASLNKVPFADRTLRSVSLSNNTSIASEVFEQRIDLNIGDELDLDQLERDIGQIHGIGTFEKVGYDIYQHQNGLDTNIYATSKSWGPNYVHFGISMDGDLKGDNGTNLVLGYTRTAMNKWAGDWTTLLQVGEEPRFLSFIHQPLGSNLSYFIQPTMDIRRINVGVYDDEDEIAEYRGHLNEYEIVIGREFGTAASLSIGLNRLSGSTHLLIGDPALPEDDFEDGGVIVKFRYDSLDDIDFPSTGARALVEYYQSHETLGADDNFNQWEVNLNGVRSYGKHVFGLGFELGGTEGGAASLARTFRLGGFFNLSGLRLNQISGDYKGLVKAVYYRKYGGSKIFPTYIGGSMEYGGAWRDRDSISKDNAFYSGSLFVGIDTPFGPMLAGWGYSEGGSSVLFTKLGRFF